MPFTFVIINESLTKVSNKSKIKVKLMQSRWNQGSMMEGISGAMLLCLVTSVYAVTWFGKTKKPKVSPWQKLLVLKFIKPIYVWKNPGLWCSHLGVSEFHQRVERFNAPVFQASPAPAKIPVSASPRASSLVTGIQQKLQCCVTPSSQQASHIREVGVGARIICLWITELPTLSNGWIFWTT